MYRFVGIDLGTSSVKTILISQLGIEKSTVRDYAVHYTKPNFSEQNPLDWYEQTLSALSELLAGIDKSTVEAISFSGQMHGLVLLDENDNVIRPAILWNDGRSTAETDYLNTQAGKDFLLENTGNIAFAGFTAPKLLWVKKNEPENFARIRKVMLPKDYLAYRLSGEFATDVSDASGTLYFNVKKRRWSTAMLDLLGIDEGVLTRVFESYEVIGNLKEDIASVLGMSKKTKIVIGGGDNACSAVGTGAVSCGDCNISLGTSGTIFVETDTHRFSKGGTIHAFCSASGKYHYLACILSAASCQKWWIEDILKTDYTDGGLKQYIGNCGVIFLPYMMGERSPINNPDAKAVFYGMTPSTTRDEMTVAILEGVAFALKQNIEIIRDMGVRITKSKICGGGAKNGPWLQIIASALNVVLEVPEFEQGGALGAALLAAKGVMACGDYLVFAKRFYGVRETVSPDSTLTDYYNEKYRSYLKLQAKMN